MKIAFVPVARVNFDMESAGKCLEASKKMLAGLSADIVMPEGHLSDYDSMVEWLKDQRDCVAAIFQASTFIDPRFALEYARHLPVPALVWGVREPSIDGGRLKLNSMTGVFALTNILYQEGIPFKMVCGNPDEPELQKAMKKWVKAAEVAGRLKTMKLGVVGSIPPGYFFSLEEETMLRRWIGPSIVHTEIYKLFRQGEQFAKEELEKKWKEHQGQIQGLDQLPEARGLHFAGLLKAVEKFVEDNKVDALCGRCWPDTFEAYDLAPCAIYSLLADKLPVACEADMGGAVTNAILTWISGGKAAYFADPVVLDEKQDHVIFWHCGFGAPSLNKPGEPITMGLHPNRKIGPTMEFAVKPGPVTICRLGKLDGEYRLLIAKGECLEAPRQFQGTSAVVRPEIGAENFMQALAMQGWEYHVSFVHGDVAEELETLALQLGIDAVRL